MEPTFRSRMQMQVQEVTGLALMTLLGKMLHSHQITIVLCNSCIAIHTNRGNWEFRNVKALHVNDFCRIEGAQVRKLNLK
jgi:hypothetical protein